MIPVLAAGADSSEFPWPEVVGFAIASAALAISLMLAALEWRRYFRGLKLYVQPSAVRLADQSHILILKIALVNPASRGRTVEDVAITCHTEGIQLEQMAGQYSPDFSQYWYNLNTQIDGLTGAVAERMRFPASWAFDNPYDIRAESSGAFWFVQRATSSNGPGVAPTKLSLSVRAVVHKKTKVKTVASATVEVDLTATVNDFWNEYIRSGLGQSPSVS